MKANTAAPVDYESNITSGGIVETEFLERASYEASQEPGSSGPDVVGTRADQFVAVPERP